LCHKRSSFGRDDKCPHEYSSWISTHVEPVLTPDPKLGQRPDDLANPADAARVAEGLRKAGFPE
jgi:hypothetical protein